MKLEMYKAYKTSGGTKAVIVGKSHDKFLAWHEGINQTRMHDDTGSHFKWDSLDLDIVSEWKEPRTWDVTIGVGEHPDGRFFVLTSIDTQFKVIGDHNVLGIGKITITEGEGL